MQIKGEGKGQPTFSKCKVGTALGSIIFLIMLVIALFWVAGELIFLHGAVPVPEGAESGQVSSVRLRDLDGDFEVVTIDVGKVHGVRPTLDLGISFWAVLADFEILLIGPGENVMWQECFDSRMTRVSTPKISFEATARGQWRLIVDGRAKNLMLSVVWKIDE